MSTTNAARAAAGDAIAAGRWHLDPDRSSVTFQVPHFWGLLKIKGRFARYEGTLDLAGDHAVALVIEAASVDTKQKARDKHLRSEAFFDADRHPNVRFLSDRVRVVGNTLKVDGRLQVADRHVPLHVEATLAETGADGELEIEATTQVDQRELGMTWSPLGIMRTPSTLTVQGRLVRDGGAR
jgi:polyisoprenoid-binding protein YceI